MEQFYVTLPSNSSQQFYGKQPLAHYRTRLAKTLHLNVSEWEVGIAEIIYPISWNNIVNATFKVRKLENSKWRWNKGRIPDGNYEDVRKVIQTLQNEINEILGDQKSNIHLSYNKSTRRVKVFLNENYGIILSNSLAQPLGFGDTENKCQLSNIKYVTSSPFSSSSFKKDDFQNEDCESETITITGDTITSTFIADVNRTLRTLYVHCNIVESQLVGDQCVPLLRTIAVKGQVDDVIADSFSNIHYMGVERSTFQEIEIHITDDTGKTIRFQQGRVVVKLHFKRK